VPRRFKLRQPHPCAVCAPAPGSEVAVGDPARRDTLCVRCDPGWSEPTAATVVEVSVGAAEADYAPAGGMFWFSRKRFSGS
jgi:hypothetical protein